ncbi:MAG: OB-fold domain-containing protein [Burkholderiaceae bacterium]|nr:OB-fold domain-containing protein [Burkholderiaceae bacterium]
MNKPEPRVNEISQQFWDGLNEGHIHLQRCLDETCGRMVFYPRVCCPFCHGAGLEWLSASGHGKVISHTTVHRPHHDGFGGEIPYVFAAIELTEGVLVYGQMQGAPTCGTSLINRSVQAIFDDRGVKQKVLSFQLV